VTSPTHAFVCFDRRGTAISIRIDDQSQDCKRTCADVIVAGGRIERMPLDEARQVKLYERPER
jgi:hypothetical protein